MNFKLPFVVLILYYVASPSMGQGITCIIPRIKIEINIFYYYFIGSPIGSDGVPITKEDLKNIDEKTKIFQSTSLTVPYTPKVLHYNFFFQIF